MAERLLDALGRHAVEGDADTSAEAEHVRSGTIGVQKQVTGSFEGTQPSDCFLLAVAPAPAYTLNSG